MSREQADPTCPECGEPVGPRATYCMHCGAEFGDEGVGDGNADGGSGLDDAIDSVVDAIDGTIDESPDVDDEPAAVTGETSRDSVVESEHAGSTGDPTATTRAGAPAGAETGAGETGLMHPDSFLDNSLTVVVGIGAGIVIGIVSLFVFGVAFGGIGVWLALAAWLGSTAYLARRRTVFDAVRDGAYGLALVLGASAIGVGIAAEGTAIDRVIAALIAAVPFGFFALVIAGVGYVVGQKGVE